jgi:hypothetical protein
MPPISAWGATCPEIPHDPWPSGLGHSLLVEQEFPSSCIQQINRNGRPITNENPDSSQDLYPAYYININDRSSSSDSFLHTHLVIMDDIEKLETSVVAPARVIIADDPERGYSVHRRMRGRAGSHSRSSLHTEDEIGPTRNSYTVPVEYRTL